MYIEFKVGRREKHDLAFHYNPNIGEYRVELDGRKFKNGVFIFAPPYEKWIEFSIGEKELHNVKIKKERKILMGSFLPQKYSIYVDDKLIKEVEGV